MTFKRSFGIGRLFKIVRRSGDVLSEEAVSAKVSWALRKYLN